MRLQNFLLVWHAAACRLKFAFVMLSLHIAKEVISTLCLEILPTLLHLASVAHMYQLGAHWLWYRPGRCALMQGWYAAQPHS